MKNFIAITEAETKTQVLLPIERIRSVLEEDDGIVWIETGVDKRGEPIGVFAAEGFEQIKQKILNCEV